MPYAYARAMLRHTALPGRASDFSERTGVDIGWASKVDISSQVRSEVLSD